MADDKTKPHGPGRDKPPSRGDRPADQSITFYCTNGHRISVPVKLAGKRGTCSKCGIALTIPMPGAAASRLAAARPSPQPEAPSPPEAAGIPEQGEPVESAIVPAAAEATDDVPGAGPATPPVDDADELQKLFASVGDADGADGQHDSSASVEPAPFGDEQGAAEPVVEGVLPAHPTSQLVARLWAEREHGGIVELHLTGGSVILPEWYEPVWSRGTHGLFASQAADGTVTLTAVAWESIQKVVVRQVQGLPDGMFVD